MRADKQRKFWSWFAAIATFILIFLAGTFLFMTGTLTLNDTGWKRLAIEILFLLAVVLPLIAYLVARLMMEHRAFGNAAQWPFVEGKITSSELVIQRGEVDVFEPRITYGYVVGGQQLSGNRIQPGFISSETEAEGNALVAKYPAGARVPVFYDPANPEESVLDPSKVGWSRIFWVAFYAIFVPAVLIILFRWFGWL